jgi:hypothetical protein
VKTRERRIVNKLKRIAIKNFYIVKHLIIIVLFVNICFAGKAQNIKIGGKVSDEKSNAVIAATVSLLSKDSVLISNTITDNSGSFELTTLKKSDFHILRVTHLVFEDSYTSLIPDKDAILTIRLIEKPNLLGEIEIVAKKPIYEFQHEKLIVNVGEIPNVQTYTMARLLQRLPGVINSDGGLTLNGQAAAVYMDGRKQTMKTNDILQALPVTAIEKIELIYSSNGVYDASDVAIINIVYKKQRVDGYYLSAGGNTAAYDKRHLDGGTSATVIFKKRQVMLNSTLSYRNSYSTSQANDTLQYENNTFLYQDRNSDSRTNAYMGMLNLSWDVRAGHNLNFNFNFYDDFSNNTSRQQYSGDVTRNVWNIQSKGNDDMWSGQIEYTSPDTLNNKFKASYGIIYGGVRNHRNTLEENSEILYTEAEMLAHRHTIKFDYEHKFSGKMNLLLGLKTDLGQLNDDVIYTKTTDSNRYPTSRFLGEENIYSGYAQLKYTFDKNWAASASLRTEHTYYFLDFMTLGEKVTDSYTHLFPYFTASYNSNNRNYKSSLSFGSSISRPDYNYMLPGVRYSNQYYYTKGNPELKPTLFYSVEWRNLFHQFINTYLRYQSGTNLMGLVAKNSSIDPLITEYEYNNMVDYSSIAFGATINYQILSNKLSGQIGGNIQHATYRNPKNGYELPYGKNNYWRGALTVMGNYQITKQLGFNAEYYFYPKYDNLVFIQHTRWLTNVGLYYHSKNDKWSLSLDVNDLFHSNKTFSERYFGDNYLKQHNYRSSQYVQLSFIMKLKGGEKVEDKAKRGSLETDRFSTK